MTFCAMKNSILFPINGLLSALLLLSFFSCSEKKFTKELITPEMSINIVGNKPNALDPFTVGLTVTHKQSKKTATLNMEVYANDLNDSNPIFETKDKGKYALIFSQTDNTVREFILYVQDNEVVLEEIL